MRDSISAYQGGSHGIDQEMQAKSTEAVQKGSRTAKCRTQVSSVQTRTPAIEAKRVLAAGVGLQGGKLLLISKSTGREERGSSEPTL